MSITYDARYEFGAVVAWVTPDDTNVETGLVLFATGCFVAELRERGPALDDHDIRAKAPFRHGLLVFEGMVEHGPGPDPDCWWAGEWRPLIHWELMQVNAGVDPLVLPDSREGQP